MIKVRIIFHVLGWPPDALNNILKKLVDGVRKSWKIISEDYSEPEKLKDTEKMYSSFVEFVAEVPNFTSLFTFVLNYAPSVVEILEPKEIVISMDELQDAFADMSAKLQDLDKQIKFFSAKVRELESKSGNKEEETKKIKLEFKK